MVESSSQDVLSATTGSRALACEGCGYDLTGLIDDRCPECGRIEAVSEARRLRPRPLHTRLKRACLGIILMTWAISMSVTGVVGDSMIISFATNVITVIATLIWCTCDARERRVHLTKLTTLAIILFIPVGLALYLVPDGRWRQLILALGFGVLAIVGSTLVGLCVGRLVTGTWPT